MFVDFVKQFTALSKLPELKSFLVQVGFTNSRADSSLFIYCKNGIVAYFLVYVDDIILTGSNTQFIEQFVMQLSNRFSLKDLGPIHQFLGVEVINTPTGLFLSQHRYIIELLEQFNMSWAKEVATPMSKGALLTLSDKSPLVDPTPFRKLVGSLQYLAFTRPDVSFTVNKLSQYMHAPTEIQWQSLKRVLRYLKGTIHHGLFLHRDSPLTLNAFSDSDWGETMDNGRSTTTYILYLGSNVISWRSSRQKSVSRSSTEAEYKAVANGAAETIWVQQLLQEFGVTISGHQFFTLITWVPPIYV